MYILQVLWSDEFKENGFQKAALSRLRFHGSLTTKEISNNTGISIATVNKHMNRLADEGFATKHVGEDDYVWFTTEKNFKLNKIERSE